MTSIGSMIGGGEMREDAKRAWEAYERVFLKVEPKKAQIVRVMSSAFNNAGSAYRAMFPDGATSDSANAKIVAGTFAGCWFECFSWLKEALGRKTTADTIETMDATSRWMEANGWHGLPKVYVGGATLTKTAAEVYSDMEAFRKAGWAERRLRDAKRSA